jgi:hypothetical protein
MSFLDFSLWVAPGVLALGLALAGEHSQPLCDFALLPLTALFWWLLILRLFRKGSVPARRTGFALFWATTIVVGDLLLGVPPWLRSNEDAAVAAVEGWKAVHGAYPETAFPELRAGLHGCVYGAQPPSYKLLCSQNMLRRCEYWPDRGWSCGEP